MFPNITLLGEGPMAIQRTSDARIPPSPSPSSASSSSSSSSEFEFTISLSPTSRRSSDVLCPADELFYKGQLLPLHLSSRLSMVRSLLLSSSSSSSARNSTGSSSSFFTDGDSSSSRPSSAAETDEIFLANSQIKLTNTTTTTTNYLSSLAARLSRLVLRKGAGSEDERHPTAVKSRKRSSPTKDVIRKCVERVRAISMSIRRERGAADGSSPAMSGGGKSRSFSGNLRFGKRKKGGGWAGSCPSSMRSSPAHSGLLFGGGGAAAEVLGLSPASSATMEELQSAIQGAIEHCKSTLKLGEQQLGA